MPDVNVLDPIIILIILVLALLWLYVATNVVVIAYLNAKGSYIRKLISRQMKMNEDINNIEKSRKGNGNGEEK